jgi:hypothetical protein
LLVPGKRTQRKDMLTALLMMLMTMMLIDDDLLGHSAH